MKFKNTKNTMIAGLAAAAAFALTGFASATPSTDQETQILPFAFPLSPGSQSLQFNLFDDMGGTRELQMVEILMDITMGAHVTATNDSEIPAEFFAVHLSGNAQASFGGLNIIALLAQTEAVPDDDLPIPPGGNWDFGFVSASDNVSDSTTMNLKDFIGAGTMNAVIEGSGGFSVEGVADATLVIKDFEASGDVTIIYHYKQIVPAPGALALFGLAGLIGARRRRCAAFGEKRLLASSSDGQLPTLPSPPTAKV
jgi:hypothetical protein